MTTVKQEDSLEEKETHSNILAWEIPWTEEPGTPAHVVAKIWTRFIDCVPAKSLYSCPTLCDPMDHNSPGSSVHWILQARILEWVSFSSSRGSSQPRDPTFISYVSCTGRRILHH